MPMIYKQFNMPLSNKAAFPPTRIAAIPNTIAVPQLRELKPPIRCKDGMHEKSLSGFLGMLDAYWGVKRVSSNYYRNKDFPNLL